MINSLMYWVGWVSFIFVFFACIEVAKKKGFDKLKTNILYTVANVFNIIYFVYFFTIQYLLMNMLFIIVSIIGIKNALNEKKEER